MEDNMFLTETHLHTKEGSSCGMLTAVEMVHAYHDAGYKTLFISNHFGAYFFCSWKKESWDEIIDRFMLGYNLAKEEGEKLGMNILLSAEIEFAQYKSVHYLIYGFDEQFLRDYPNLDQMTVAEFSALAKEKGIFFVQAHPYRDTNTIVTPELVDAFEVCNPNPRHDNHDDMCEKTANEYGILWTAGSDAHRYCDVAGTGIISEYEIKTAEDYINLIKSGKAVIKRP